MVRAITQSYEQSSEGGRERHERVPYARMEDVTPTNHDPAAVLSAIVGTQLTGTIISLDTVDSEAIVNVAAGAVYRHNVRTVITYNQGVAENGWRAIAFGDPVYYDRSASMPAFTKLSLSPLAIDGTANPLFGYVVMLQDEVAGSFAAKVAGAAGNTWECAVMQK